MLWHIKKMQKEHHYILTFFYNGMSYSMHILYVHNFHEKHHLYIIDINLRFIIKYMKLMHQVLHIGVFGIENKDKEIKTLDRLTSKILL